MLNFSKYNSTGNDFVIIDNRLNTFKKEANYISRICNRQFGVGADGLILLEESKSSNYFMNYFNSDGFPSTFCGNGSLCCAHFADKLNVINKRGSFETREGVFNCFVNNDDASISMSNVSNFDIRSEHVVINTGSPHYVVFVDDLDIIDVNALGKKIRFSKEFYEDGINVTFTNITNNKISIRTFERGVEAETLSCGTGAVAAVMSAILRNLISAQSIDVLTKGGVLNVSLKFDNSSFSNILLSSFISTSFQGKLHF